MSRPKTRALTQSKRMSTRLRKETCLVMYTERHTRYARPPVRFRLFSNASSFVSAWRHRHQKGTRKTQSNQRRRPTIDTGSRRRALLSEFSGRGPGRSLCRPSSRERGTRTAAGSTAASPPRPNPWSPAKGGAAPCPRCRCPCTDSPNAPRRRPAGPPPGAPRGVHPGPYPSVSSPLGLDDTGTVKSTVETL
eukprot:1186408-Prorocentrum_minimum.AAC.3